MTAQLNESPPEGVNFRERISKNIVKTKKVFDSTKTSLKKIPAVNELKNYHALWVSAMMGIVPSPEETKIAYEARQKNTTDKLNQAWARFELEL